jgi:hypothetical protein
MNEERPETSRRGLRSRLTYANVMATIAVFVALGGSSYAAMKLPNDSVGTNQLKESSVSTAKLKGSAITSPKIAKEAVNGSKIKLSSLGTVPSATLATTANEAKTLGGMSSLQILSQAHSEATTLTDQAKAASAVDSKRAREEAIEASELECPAGTTASGGACFSGLHAAALWFEAAKTCAAEEMTLPSAPQLYAYGKANTPGGSGPEWTSDALSTTTALTITASVSGEGAGERPIFETPGVPFHCVGYPTN